MAHGGGPVRGPDPAEAGADWGETPGCVAAGEELARTRQIASTRYLQELGGHRLRLQGVLRTEWWISVAGRWPHFSIWRLGEDPDQPLARVGTGFFGRQPIDGAILSATPSWSRLALSSLAGLHHVAGRGHCLDGGRHRCQAGGAQRTRRVVRAPLEADQGGNSTGHSARRSSRGSSSTFHISGGEIAGFSLWLVLMQGAGVVAALITLLIALPTATRLGQLDPTR